ncbi:hypothetical protein R6V09_01065 [Streptomyces sp. W16]|uniref:hypothetical protein n=1 Tax=Streptomyces sp. W16 TaxID=3076631 RepID=UPI00295AAC73|nr:hypothetical protein [Streptomyces sp. W16]MDV9168733.1 hypothetical protein [Streptomyces sp. W16]
MINRRGGPYPHRRLSAAIKTSQGIAVLELVAAGATFRQAAAATGLSPTTAWRRAWWIRDLNLPHHFGRPLGPNPPQRGTARCPRGRPWMPTLDGPAPARKGELR